MEHITTKDAVDYVFSENENLAATVTTHHLSINRNDLLAGGIRPHFYCLPVVKEKPSTGTGRGGCFGVAKIFFRNR